MKKLFIIFLFLFLITTSPIYATVPCPEGGCPAGSCTFAGNCGECCKCRNGCGGGEVCPWCDPFDCSQLNEAPYCSKDIKPQECWGKWLNGNCPGGKGGCEEYTITCACSNGSQTCHRFKECGGPTEPPNTPKPTKPPNPPTPTPIQPTEVITLPLPSPTVFSQQSGNTTLPGQIWLCLQSKPCSDNAVNCSGKGDKVHRVQITTDRNNTTEVLYPNRTTYIFECLETGGFRCTSGNPQLDRSKIGTDDLSWLYANYGYEFIDMSDIWGNSINQGLNPVTTDLQGQLGVYEWESFTTKQVGRLMMSMQELREGEARPGNQNTLKIGNAFVTFKEDQTICVMIKWDPYGQVFDADTKKPVENVKVTLLIRKNNMFIPVTRNDILGGIINPIFTDSKGQYSFFVPDGIYKLKLEKDGYETIVSDEIITQGKREKRNIELKKLSFFDKTISFFNQFFQ